MARRGPSDDGFEHLEMQALRVWSALFSLIQQGSIGGVRDRVVERRAVDAFSGYAPLL
jgi:hypothetical protein